MYFFGGVLVENIKFVEHMYCGECVKKLKLYGIEYKKQVLAERAKLRACFGCAHLREIAENIRSGNYDYKKDTNRKTKSSGI